MFACSHLFKWIVITQSEMCFVGVRPRPAWAWSPGQLGHGRWLGTGAPWSAPSPVTSDITRGNRSADTRHTVTRSHTHAVKHTRTQSVRWGWGHWSAQYTVHRAEEERLRESSNGWWMSVVCSLAERDWGKLDKNVLWRNKQLISSSHYNSVSRNKKFSTDSFHFKHYVNIWPWILKPWYFLAKTSLYVVP